MDERNEGFNKLRISYDHNTDTLYLFVGDQENSIARDAGKGILIKYNQKTNQPVGAIVHDFEARFSKQNKPFDIPAVSAALQPA